MKKILGIVIIVALLISMLVSVASAESLEILDRVDIGDPASEAGHNVDGWGPLEPDSHPWLDYGAPWSELGDGKARVIWTVGGDYPCATLTLDRHIAAGTASVIRFRHLDGIYLIGYDGTERWADDSFTVSVKNHGDADSAYQQVYEYTATGRTTSTSQWLVHEFDLPSSLNLDEDIDVKFCATGTKWEYFGSDLGQVAFDWIELWGEQPTPIESKTEPNGEQPADPRDIKENVKDCLADYVDESKRFGKAIKEIEKSLDPKYWADDTHLVCKYGKKVFDKEGNAVKELMYLLNAKKSKISAEALACAQEAVEKLVGVDRILAETLIIDAEGTPVTNPKDQKKVDKSLAKANKELAKGDADRDAGKFDKAIAHYRNAWEDALKAIEKATGEKCLGGDDDSDDSESESESESGSEESEEDSSD